MIKHLSYFLAKCLTVATSALKQEEKEEFNHIKVTEIIPLEKLLRN